MEAGTTSVQVTVGTAWVLAVGLLLVGCTSDRSAGGSAPVCDLISTRTVEKRFGVTGVRVRARKASCEFSVSGSEDPFLIISRADLDGTPLGALIVGEAAAGHGDEAISSDKGGPLGAAAAVRSGSTAIRVDLRPTGNVSTDRANGVALDLAGGAARRATAGRRQTPTTPPISFCDQLATITTVPGDGTPIHLRPINTNTCEARVEGHSGSVYISEAMHTGATAADVERAAGAGAAVVEVGDTARWAPTPDGRGGSLWLLSGRRLIQLNVQDVDAADRGSALTTALAQSVVRSGGEG